MRKMIFNDSQCYIGFSSKNRGELGQSLKLPPIFKSQMYKDKDANDEPTHKTMIERRASNDRYKTIRDYSETRREVLESLTKPILRNSPSIFGLQKSSFNGNTVTQSYGNPYE